LDNLESIVKKLLERIQGSTQTLNDLRQEKEKVFSEFDKNLQTEKEHFNKVKFFESECEKNELLMKQIKEIKRAKKQAEMPAEVPA